MHAELLVIVHAVLVGLVASRSFSLSILHIVRVKISGSMQSALAGIVIIGRLASDMLGKLRQLYSFCIESNLRQSLIAQLATSKASNCRAIYMPTRNLKQ